MADPIREVNRLLEEAAQLPMEPGRVGIVERAVRLADAIPDDELAFGARLELVSTATFAGMPERSLVAFAWLLGKCDDDPGRFDIEELLFPYRWIVEDVPYLLSVSAERVDALIDDMERRYREQWWWEHPVAEARLRWAMVRGAPSDDVTRLLGRWRTEFDRSENQRGGHEVHTATIALAHLGRWEDAVAVARPSISGDLAAEDEYPARTFAALVEPARHLQLPERGIWRARAAELCAGNQVFVREVSAVVIDFVRDDQTPPPALVDDLKRWVASSRDEHGVMMASAALACAEPGAGQRNANRDRAVALAERFDARNGSRETSRRVLEHLDADQ